MSLKLKYFNQEVPLGLRKFIENLPLGVLTDFENMSTTGDFSDLFTEKRFVNKRFRKSHLENQILVTNKKIKFEHTSLCP